MEEILRGTSASIPVVFPPILIDVEANGRRFEEMHADGAVMAPVLTLPDAFLLRNGNFNRDLHIDIYILINNKVDPDFQVVRNNTADIAARSSASLTKRQTRSILYDTFDFARHNKLGFNLTYIDGNVPSPASPDFDTGYMRSLYEYGYEKAKTGPFWEKAPPSNDRPLNGGREQRVGM